MADKYVSNINLTDRYRKFVAAGTPFVKELMVTDTFNALARVGHITKYDMSNPIAVVKGPKGKMLASIPATTPEAAIHPPTLTQEQKDENARQAALDVKKGKVENAEKGASKEVEKVEKAKENLAEEEAATVALTAAEAEDAKEAETEDPEAPKKESTVEKIWDCDPNAIKGLKMEHLLSEYRSQCAKYKIEPKTFTDKKLLIAQLSSEFVAK